MPSALQCHVETPLGTLQTIREVQWTSQDAYMTIWLDLLHFQGSPEWNLIIEMCISKYIYCELNAMTDERKVQIDLDTSKLVTILGCPYICDSKSTFPILMNGKLRVCRYNSFGPAFHSMIEAWLPSIVIVNLNLIDKAEI